MKYWKRVLAAVLICAAALSLWGCGQPEEEVVPTLSLRIAMEDSPVTLDPAMVSSDTEKTLVVHLFENLMRRTDDGPVPALAKSWECVDNLDGTETYRFTLRDDIRWSDGRRVSAYDFVYSWRRLVSPDTASPNAALLDMVAGYEAAAAGDTTALQVSAEDDATLAVALNCHCPYFLGSICTAAATMPVRPDTAAQPDWAMHRDTLLTNGAYTVTTWTGEVMRMSQSEDYYDKKRVGAAQLEFRFALSTEEAMAQYAQGELDAVMEAEDAEGAILSYRPEVTLLLVNQMSATLHLAELRQAMSLVIDRTVLCEQLGERYIPAEGLVPRGTVSTQGGSFRALGDALIDNRAENYAANCTAAAGLLDRIAYDDEVLAGLGVITLLYENTPEQTLTAQTLQQVWQEKLGVRVTLKASSAENMQIALGTGVFTIALTTVTSDRNDASGYLARFAGGSDGNYGIFYSNAYDMLLRAADAAKSAEARDAYLADAERLLLESGYVIPLYDDTHFWLVRPELVGALDNGQDTHCFTYVREVQPG